MGTPILPGVSDVISQAWDDASSVASQIAGDLSSPISLLYNSAGYTSSSQMKAQIQSEAASLTQAGVDAGTAISQATSDVNAALDSAGTNPNDAPDWLQYLPWALLIGLLIVGMGFVANLREALL
jgi:hypothetical protein